MDRHIDNLENLSLEERRAFVLKARQEKEQDDENWRQRHLAIAQALRNPETAQEIIDLAMIHVRQWEGKKLCSPYYIDGWKELLSAPQKAADLLEERSAYARSMRQNTPFVSSIRKMAQQ